MMTLLGAVRVAVFVGGLALAVADDVRRILWIEVHRRIDALVHGAPCRCCFQEDCWAEPSSTPQETRQ